MKYRISKQFQFDAAHWLPGLPPDHKCGRMHGHTYTVAVELGADKLDLPGFVADFSCLDVLNRYLDDTLDHQVLNDVLPVPPTSENLAEHLYDWCRQHLRPLLPTSARVCAVRVSETPRTWAEYRPEPSDA